MTQNPSAQDTPAPSPAGRRSAARLPDDRLPDDRHPDDRRPDGRRPDGRRRPGRWVRRLLLWGGGSVAGLLVLGSAIGCCAFSAPRYQGPASVIFDGEQFQNQPPTKPKGFGDFLRWQLHREPGPWRSWTDAPAGPPPPRLVAGDDLRVTFVNHATTLIQTSGTNILTDPIWSQRASPVSWAGPKRVRPPGIAFADLPPVHVVLISHNHYDHLDLPTLKRLQEHHNPRFVVPLGNSAVLREAGIHRVAELTWWEELLLQNGLKVAAVPAQHFSSRGLCDRNANLWAGYVLLSPGGPIYFAGDTGFGPHFQEIHRRYGPQRLAILPIGAFQPRWFMKSMHVSPEEAVAAHRVLRAGTSLAIHFGTFKLADDGQDEPPTRLERALKAAGVSPDQFWLLEFGEGRAVLPLKKAGASQGEGVSS